MDAGLIALVLLAAGQVSTSSTSTAARMVAQTPPKAGSNLGAGYTLFPADLTDAEERIIAFANLGFNGSFGGLNGEPDANDRVPEDVLRDKTTLVTGDLRLGWRGMFYPTFNVYSLVTLGANLNGQPRIDLDFMGEPVDQAIHPDILDPFGGAHAFVRLVYAELEGLTRDGALSHVALRAGRQSHFGAGSVTFDGATVRVSDEGFSLSARFGQTSSIYDRFQDNGLVGGADVILNFARINGTRLTLKAEYLFIDRDITLNGKDTFRLGVDTVEAKHGFALANIAYDVTDDLFVSAALSLFNENPSHARLLARWFLGENALSVELDQKLGEEVLFPAAGLRTFTVVEDRTGLERRALYEVHRLNIPDRANYTDARLELSLALSDAFEIVPNGGVHFVSGDDVEKSPFDRSGFWFGVLSQYALPIGESSALEAEVEYEGRIYLEDDANVVLLSGRAADPERSSHQIYAGVSYQIAEKFVSGRALSGRSLNIGAGGFAKFYSLETVFDPDIGSESFIGLSVEAQYQILKQLGILATYELAKDSSVFASHLDLFHGVRVNLQASF